MNDHRVECENGVYVTQVKRNVKSLQSVSTRSSKRKKKHKARKPPIIEYTFSEPSFESQEASKHDKEAKKPVTGEYSFVTNIDDIELDVDKQVEKFTYI